MSECRFQEPKIVCKNGGYEYLDDYVFGFGRICASDERIYAAYDGQSTAAGYRMPPEGSRPLLFGNIAVFDWLGRPIAIYRSDYRIDCICIDAAESDVLFATLSDAEGRKYTGRISL